MSSIRILKKEMNIALSEVIEDCYLVQLEGDDAVAAKADKIIDEAIGTFDQLIEKVHKKDVDDKKAHFRTIKKDLIEAVEKLDKKVAKLTA